MLRYEFEGNIRAVFQVTHSRTQHCVRVACATEAQVFFNSFHYHSVKITGRDQSPVFGEGTIHVMTCYGRGDMWWDNYQSYNKGQLHMVEQEPVTCECGGIVAIGLV